MASPTQSAWFGGRELYGTLQASIRAGGEQLAPLAGLNVPLVVVVTNPLHSDVSFFGDDVVSALFGEVRVRVTLDDPGDHALFAGGEHGAVLHRDMSGEVVNRLPHLSAVIALDGVERFPRVDVYDLSGIAHFAGTPLPRSMFNADDDTWTGSLGDDRYGRLPPA